MPFSSVDLFALALLESHPETAAGIALALAGNSREIGDYERAEMWRQVSLRIDEIECANLLYFERPDERALYYH